MLLFLRLISFIFKLLGSFSLISTKFKLFNLSALIGGSIKDLYDSFRLLYQVYK